MDCVSCFHSYFESAKKRVPSKNNTEAVADGGEKENDTIPLRSYSSRMQIFFRRVRKWHERQFSFFLFPLCFFALFPFAPDGLKRNLTFFFFRQKVASLIFPLAIYHIPLAIHYKLVSLH